MSRLPVWAGVASPFNKVLELFVAYSGIEDIFDFVFFVVVDLDRRGFWVLLSWVWISAGWVQEVNMEDWMDFHRGRKVQLICSLAYGLKNLKRSHHLSLQFLCGSLSSDIASVQPNLIPGFVRWRWDSFLIGLFFLDFLGSL
jgi:hypothetical protein